jgi:AcrR family transcriptional regulator
LPAEPKVIKTRDAERTRAAVLDAAERIFADAGYEGASIADIAERADVSRGTPGYFFGSKEQLYIAVLERLYRDRDAALRPVFAPLERWAASQEPDETLGRVLGRCVDGYLTFLLERPTYIRIMEREALSGAARLRRVDAESTVMEDAFRALRRRAGAHNLKRFDPTEIIMLLTALAFFPIAHEATLLRRQGLTVADRRFVARRRRHIVDLLLHALGAPGD